MDGTSVRTILAQNIKRLRENRNMSQADLAFEAGISIPFLSDIERGNKWPSPETVAKIATALNIELFQLFSSGLRQNEETEMFISKIIDEITVAQNLATKAVCEKYLK